MNNLPVRIILILLHAAISLYIVTWLIKYDITGKWIYFIGFIVLLLALLYFLVRHAIAFVTFLKTKTK